VVSALESNEDNVPVQTQVKLYGQHLCPSI